MKKISIVIPTMNELDFLLRLLSSLEKIDYPRNCYEVIVVNDGSSDKTAEVVAKNFPGTILVDLPVNVGRYKARKAGVEISKFDNILFVDSRSLASSSILKMIDQCKYKAINGRVINGNLSNPYTIFAEAIRRLVFSKYYRNSSRKLKIDKDNFDSFPKGTSLFFVQKDILLSAYQDLSNIDMGKLASDDTKLIYQITKYTPIFLNPDVVITRFDRSSFISNYRHLIWRGSTFVDYYFSPKKRNFWLVIVLPLIIMVGGGAGIVFISAPFIYKFLVVGILDLLFSFILANNFRESMTIAFMIPVCASAFYAGVVRGMFFKLIKFGWHNNGKEHFKK